MQLENTTGYPSLKRPLGVLGKVKIVQDYVLEPVFLNVYGAQESIQRNEFRQPM
jgi:hypothetical protein